VNEGEVGVAALGEGDVWEPVPVPEISVAEVLGVASAVGDEDADTVVVSVKTRAAAVRVVWTVVVARPKADKVATFQSG
jgi:hypothetical protein